MQLIKHHEIFLPFDWLLIKVNGWWHCMQTPVRSLPIVKATRWCLTPPRHYRTCLTSKVFHFQPSRHIPSHPLCSTPQHSYHPHTPPSFDWLTNHPPTQLPPSDIHPTDTQPGPRLWPSSDHDALSRGRNKRHWQRLRRVFRAKRKRRLCFYLTPLFQLHGFYVTRKNNCSKVHVLCVAWKLISL